MGSIHEPEVINEVAEPVQEPVELPAPEQVAQVIPMPEPVKPSGDYRQRVAGRKGDGRQMTLF